MVDGPDSRTHVESEIPRGETLSRELLANERTLLSWVRTGINAIGLGILLDVTGRTLSVMTRGDSRYPVPVGAMEDQLSQLGVVLVVFGSVIMLVAVARFLHYGSLISRGEHTSSYLVYLLLVLGVLLLGVAYSVYSVFV